ncbi:MAG: NUDIX domain-containing protein [Nocardioidaceae bacterium]|nr:NUDIX domain-containing protein [Nocardioidaceae bacterium]
MDETAEEQVGLFDEQGRPAGSAPRSQVRRENLRHAATAVLVRDGLGRVYVHRRTTMKDVFPGLHDCVAGGVLEVGEDPTEGAARELEEELGITGVELRPLGRTLYEDEQTRYWAHQFAVVWHGPVRWQASEVDWGTWMTPDELRAHLADPAWPFVPDTRAVMGPLLDTL